jgi:TonB-linked SusC/RagA family outer membrane protein
MTKYHFINMKRLIILFICVQWVCFAFAQPIQLKGKVKSVDGERLVGVSVFIEGANSSTTTDPEGYYQLQVNTGDRVSFAYLGFKKETITVADQEVVDITLKEGDTALLNVAGTVTDEATGRPLVGAQIKVVDTPYSAFADEEGHFSIEAPSLQDILLVTAPDYVLREFPLLGRATVAVQLYRQGFTSGYGTVQTLKGNAERKTLSLVSAAQSNDFSISAAIALEQEIQARLGNDVRTVTRSGTPGMGAVMFIRGLNSLNANAQPLIVVDGVIWDSQLSNASIHSGFFSDPLANIEVKDIESITVLKDGNSIYGSRAANGVILVNTVRGKDMTTRITANLSWGSNLKPRLPKMMNAAQYISFASDQAKSWLTAYEYRQSSLLQLFPYLNENPHKDYTNDTDWQDVVYQDGMIQSYSLNVNGGDEVALYNLSMGYSSAEGTVVNTGMERYHARFNSDIKVYSNVFTKVDIAIARTTRDLRDQGNSNLAPETVASLKAPILAPYGYLNNGELSPTLAKYDNIDPRKPLSNPLALIEKAIGSASRVGFKLKVNPYWQVNENLKLESLFAYGMDRVKESYFIPQEGVAPWLITETSTYGSNAVQDYTQRQVSIFSDSRAEWKFDLNNGHHFSLFAGFRYLSDTYESDLLRGYNTGNDNVKVLTGKLTASSVTGVNEAWKSMSCYADLEYNLQKKYFFSLTAAADASSRFGKKTKGGITFAGQPWGIFPSAGAAWLISSEDFMQNFSSVDFLKLRLSYGLTGNDDINSNAGRSYFIPFHVGMNAFGLLLGNIQNEAIQWETSTKAGLGLDAHLFNERLVLSADVFHSKTDNLLTLKQLHSVAGIQNYWSNGGALQNTGGEVSFSAKLLNLRNFIWELGAGVGHYKNKITALPDGDFDTTIEAGTVRTAVGQPASVFYGYKTLGVFATATEAAASRLSKRMANTELTPYQAGDVHFVDIYPDGIIDKRDRTVIGDPNPDFYGSVSSRFQYKRFVLDALFTYSYGNDVYNVKRRILESGDRLYNQTVAFTERWTAEGQVTTIPRAVYGDPMENNIFSDRWIEDGSYLRLKTLTLSYEMPFNFPYLQGITVWASANNLYTWTKYLGSDPEFSMNNTVLSQGIDAMLTPVSKSFHLGIKINL